MTIHIALRGPSFGRTLPLVLVWTSSVAPLLVIRIMQQLAHGDSPQIQAQRILLQVTNPNR
ncbi:uncharacterized protein BO97DRAFT_403848 [Aspergillus homomorphus CBS 101889]|uniref:Uncharacterized protein n=1 Tax=Aspergillus homomorphus (strain CBS 101889) TaxID=1450537 RepID=A0A395I4U3_ASPHC|nr:hypothetical protein BO97DRAFT_403848 [Aspergillus homomorphus CBS 101889]RAL14795.1 hypothetical protein BO97DRAFT_403848 [Aspergillus homomorphus CBS 101889]